MQYLPFSTIAEAYGWSHEKECEKVWDKWLPRNMRDTLYLYRVLEHPTKDEALVALPDSQADPESTTLDADELANLLDTLPAEYEPEVEA